MQTVKLDKLIKLFDSPGIVLSKETDPASLVLRNCVRIETIEDPVPAIELLLRRCSKDQMMLQYNLPDFQDVHDFLSKMAVKMGSLKKGGIADVRKAAQRVLSDWTCGKLTYFTEPPERNEILSTELVKQMNDAFDIDSLLASENEHLNELRNTPLTGISLPASSPTNVKLDGDSDMDDDDEKKIDDESTESMDEDDKSLSTIQPEERKPKKVHFTVQINDNKSRLAKKKFTDSVDKEEDEKLRHLVKRSNLARQKDFKKMKKNIKKSEKSVSKLGDALDSIIRFTTPTVPTATVSPMVGENNVGDSYNFSTDFL